MNFVTKPVHSQSLSVEDMLLGPGWCYTKHNTN